MRKRFIVLLIIFLSALTACGSTKPEGLYCTPEYETKEVHSRDDKDKLYFDKYGVYYDDLYPLKYEIKDGYIYLYDIYGTPGRFAGKYTFELIDRDTIIFDGREYKKKGEIFT